MDLLNSSNHRFDAYASKEKYSILMKGDDLKTLLRFWSFLGIVSLVFLERDIIDNDFFLLLLSPSPCSLRVERAPSIGHPITPAAMPSGVAVAGCT
jgi:hypothetical protein